MNVLVRVSAVMTNAPIILNMDCDMFVNNSQVVLHAMCLLLGFDDETCSGFVQVPQRFYGKLKDDPFGNQMEVLREKLLGGLSGPQGIFYLGTGCFHCRKIIYGVAPSSFAAVKHEREGSLSYEDLRTKFGASVELVESTRNIYSREIPPKPMVNISSCIQVAKQVSSCNYETGTHWGQEIGWSYGSMAEDILTGQRIHSAGWKSTLLDTNPPAFLGCAPTGIISISSWLVAFLSVVLKAIGLSKIVFEVTRKDKSTSDGDPSTHENTLGWFTFDSSPVFIPMTSLAILNIVTIAIGVWRHATFWMTTGNHDCQNIGEFVYCGWTIL